jgi:hypothetical protein
MARYKYSENTKEVTNIYFDTETHGEFMGIEQGLEMKKVSKDSYSRTGGIR